MEGSAGGRVTSELDDEPTVFARERKLTNRMRILVTGGAGYVGSTLVPLMLNRGHTVRVLDSLLHGGRSILGLWADPQFEFLRGDIRDAQIVAKALKGVDAVVHLAAIVGDPACARQPELAQAVNLGAPLRLLAASRDAGISRFISASTCSNYGKMADPSEPVDEDSPLQPVSLYARTKVELEKAVLDPAQTKGICATSLRFATVFGVSPRMRFDLTVNEFTMLLLTRKYLEVYGEQFWRPYAHVRDVSRAVIAALEAEPAKVRNRVFNVGDSGQNFTKRQLVEMIRPHAPDAVVEYVHKAEDPRDYRVSFERIQRDLGFSITRTVADGIAEVAALVNDRVIQDFDNSEYRN